MRITSILTLTILSLALTACSGVEIQPSDPGTFAAGQYRYYKWRSEPLVNTISSADAIYAIDPIIRREVNSALQAKGYVLDPGRAHFSVDYLFALGLREGAKSEQASNISPIPSVTPNRQVDQAIVDNANALGGLKETSNIVVQFNDVDSRKEVWRVVITKFVENANSVDKDRVAEMLNKAMNKALKNVPDAGARLRGAPQPGAH